MTTWKKVGLAALGVILLAGLIVLVLYLRGLNKPQSQPSPSPSPSKTPVARTLGTEKFGPHARLLNTVNVDVGVRTVRPLGTPTPTASPDKQSNGVDQPAFPIRLAAQAVTIYYPPSPSPSAAAKMPTPNPRPATPIPTPAPTPTQGLPAFKPLAPAPVPQMRDFIIVYAKGETQKRQIYARSLERDKDDQLVSSVFDDYGVALSSANQKVAFYSNEEGPSDANRARTKLKVVDLATGIVSTIAQGLPGNWPVAWSGDGKKLAIPITNSIFIADVTTGKSLQVPTAKNPGAIVWSPSNLKFYFQAETATDNNDIFEADAITAQPKTVVTSPLNERYPSVSADGTQLSFLRDGAQDRPGAAVVLRNLVGNDEKTFSETQPAGSYLFNLELKDLLFVRANKEAQLNRLKTGGSTQAVGNLGNPTIISWDRDYQHIFVLADDDQGKALFSVDIDSGQAEKVKGGISDTTPTATR